MNNFNSKKAFKDLFTTTLKDQFNITVEKAETSQLYEVLAKLLNEELNEDYLKTNKYVLDNNLKRTIYFSMEFLMGRLITNNLQNSGHYDLVKESFKELGIDLNSLEDFESDTGLGNGGLGRLAACFLDSAASLSLPLYGNSLRYEKGFFIQEFKNNLQVEHPDPWLDKGFFWEDRKEEEAIEVPFFGHIENTVLKDPMWITAVPYDVKIVGDTNGVVTHLRLWKAEPSALQTNQDDNYLNMVSKITESLYPDDSTTDGKRLRLQQQYLFSAAGVQAAINEHKSLGRDIRDLDKFYTFQINDTHPTFVIPELLRILMDLEGLDYDESWDIITKTVAFTNHTILAEALEKWNKALMKDLLPRIYEIIEEMDRRFKQVLVAKGFNDADVYNLSLLGNDNVRMAHICIYGSFSVNGVAALHSDILKNIVLKDFADIYPEKFNNKTNGITHRRWLLHINHELVSILDDKVKGDWRRDLSLIEELYEYRDDKATINAIKDMKQTKKQALVDRIKELEGIELDVNSIFDIQVKRLHEYKRQLMNILHIIYLYNRLKTDAEFKKNFHPQSFIFGAKAAPSYYMAKRIIELINTSSDVINNDEDTNHLLKVVFVENYNVTYAEYIMTAADLSEQISTASKEASGTGNMKFMLNGALTIGTMDGANVEIVGLAGKENNFIFGMSAEEVNNIYENNNYDPKAVYESDQRLQDVFAFIETLNEDPKHFEDIKQNLLTRDYFMVLKDFDSYVEAQEIANQAYKNSDEWFKKALINISKAGFFTSDRTIGQYNDDLWKLDKIKVK